MAFATHCFSSPIVSYPSLAPPSSHGQPGLSLNRHLLLTLLKSCAKQKDLLHTRKLHADLLQNQSLLHDVYLANGLLNAYVKCGALDDAQSLFDGLRFRNVVSWNTLISGFIHHGAHDEALRSFRQMRNLGISPNQVTYACILKACANTSSLPMGEEIHKEVSDLGLLRKNIIVGTALVDMYAKCGLLGKAKEVFEDLLEKDVVAWNALISGYIQHELHYDALKCFLQMRAQGESPNAVTFTCVLKACANTGSLELGEEIHVKVLQLQLLQKNVEIGNALIDMYAKCGRLDKAKELFDNLIMRNIVSWNALISGYVQQGFNEDALRYFKQMQDEAFVPDNFTFSCVLKACSNEASLEMGEKVHSEIKKLELLEKDPILCNALMDMYAKCGMPSKVQEVFDELPMRNVVHWNTLIAGYAQHGRGYDALNCYRCMCDEGISPDAATFTSILNVCGNIKYLELGENVHTRVLNEGLLEINSFIGIALVGMYAKCGFLGKAHEIFEKLPDQDVVAWNALISGYTQQNCHQEAIKYFMQMQDKNIIPNAITFLCVLNACASLKFLELGKEVHSELCKRELLHANNVLQNALVDMYIKCGELLKAREVFDEFPARNVVSWNILIAGYAQHGLGDEAQECFLQMKDEGLSPDLVTFSSILKACCSIGSLALGQEIHREICKQGLFGKDIVLCTALMDMYSKCGQLETAEDIFNELPVQNVATWTALMSGYGQTGKPDYVLKLFGRMIGEGIEPDLVTFIVMLSACVHAGLVKEGQMIFDYMDRVYCQAPTIEHYSCMVDLFSRVGHFDKAIMAIEKVPFVDRLPLWLSLLGACSKWVNVALGQLAYAQSIYLDEKCITAYVCMSNLYMAAGMHGEAAKIDVLRVKSEACGPGGHFNHMQCAFIDNG